MTMRNRERTEGRLRVLCDFSEQSWRQELGHWASKQLRICLGRIRVTDRYSFVSFEATMLLVTITEIMTVVVTMTVVARTQYPT